MVSMGMWILQTLLSFCLDIPNTSPAATDSSKITESDNEDDAPPILAMDNLFRLSRCTRSANVVTRHSIVRIINNILCVMRQRRMLLSIPLGLLDWEKYFIY